MADAITTALNAYASAGRALASPGLNPRDGTAEGDGFGDLLRQATGAAVDSLKQGEQASLSGVAGKSSITDVATALANAETTLQTVVAVRDRVISAYQDIIKMPM
ncbi:MAG TPA: flagellar hook-basal body complex protein FliE [Stellaceae bacterium]|nr:flagellar hook-basal body complex protein FliE [Stellaceae bacterium]